MSDNSVFPVPAEAAASAWCDEAAYFKLYEQSIADPDAFWGEHGKRIHWFKPYTQVKDVSFGASDVHIKWYADGTTNACYTCIDRHLPAKQNENAIIWEGDSPPEKTHIKIGKTSGRQRVCQSGKRSAGAVSLKKKKKN